MTTICRIEYPNTGKGLFTSRTDDGEYIHSLLNCRIPLAEKHSDFPTPYEDENLGDLQEDEFCAFKSIQSLQEWILPEWMKEIIKAGFKVYLLDVSECRIGEYQVLFKKENILQSKNITSLFQ